ncbi:hypothetical protein B0H14DRAFT_3478234 [Mycena olivaceomarginata]|nr:hypothetical protein B0H14DRAFT_3478234 [Mycena olivaceomarginata]
MPLRFSDKEVNLLCDDALPRPARTPLPVHCPAHLSDKQTASTSHPPTIYCANGQMLGHRLIRPLPKTPQTPQTPSRQRDLMPVFLSFWHETESLRTTEELALPPTRPCGCKTRTLDIAVVRMNAIEYIKIRICHCQTVGEQLLTAGLFPCSPQPSLAVDVGVLEFVRQLFVNLPPNNTAFCNTLEGFLASRGYKLTTKDTLCVRFANALEWYTTLRTMVGNEIDKLLNATRQILRGDEISDPPATPAQSSAVPSARATPVAGALFPPSPTASVPAPPSGRPGSGKCYRAHVSEETDSKDKGAGGAPNPFPDPPPCTHPTQSSAVPSVRATPVAGATFPPSPTASVPAPPSGQPGLGKCYRAHVSEETDSEDEGAGGAPNPFPNPLPRTHPSDYLISRCPTCFGGLEHDPSQQVDIEVCLDGCYTQERKRTKAGRDPPPRKFLPDLNVQ